MNQIKQKLQDILKNTIKTTYDINLDEINLETPPKKELWDFAFGCFVLSKELHKNPAIIALELKDILLSPNFLKSGLKDISTAGPYLNIKLDYSFYADIFKDYTLENQNIWQNQNIVIDYIWANVWKPLHIGHMCTPNIWQVIINLYKKLWYNVISDSHIGDWGIIFWKLILAYKKWWDEEKLFENAVEYLLELYIKITSESEKDNSLEEQFRQEFKKLSSWNKESVEFWAKFTSESIKAVNISLSRMWIKPDFDIWESFYEGIWLPKLQNYPDLKYSMKDIVKELVEKWIATKNEDGSIWVIFPDEKIPSCMLQKRDGTHGYLASDLAAIKYRIDNWNPKKILYFVDVRQKLHLTQAFEIAKLAWWINIVKSEDDNNKCDLIHAYNWFISLKTGAMSSRKWNIIKLDKLLDESNSRAKKIILEKRNDISWEELEELAEIIWIWAIKYWYLSKSRTSDVVFDWDDAMTFEWNSWPYLQYAYVRALRIIEKSEFSEDDIDNFLINSKFWSSFEVDLFNEIVNYNDILLEVSENLLPHQLCAYLYSLTKSFSSFYNNVQILWEKDEEYKKFKLKLVLEFVKIVRDIFEILAIKLPTKM